MKKPQNGRSSAQLDLPLQQTNNGSVEVVIPQRKLKTFLITASFISGNDRQMRVRSRNTNLALRQAANINWGNEPFRMIIQFESLVHQKA